MSFTMGMMPIERPKGGQVYSRSAHNSPVTSPAGSRQSSVSSVGSAYTDSGIDGFHQSSTPASSVESQSSSKSGFRSLFSKKEKKPKEKIVITSKHAFAVQQKMLMDDAKRKNRPQVKTAGVVGTIKSGHLTAADQEARHPHSGSPALHGPKNGEMPVLTRITSADEPDEEDELEKNLRQRAEYARAKQSTIPLVAEHHGDDSNPTSAEVSADEDDVSRSMARFDLSSQQTGHTRPSPFSKSSFGGRYHRDEHGAWKR